ncbi:MAG TPA: DUF1800 domain-containing protein [Myxococcales bacterium]
MRMRTATALLLLLPASCLRTARKDDTPPLKANAAQAAAAEAATADSPKLTQPEMIEHMLDRVTFGSRLSDVRHVQAIGISAYLEDQLHPEEIEDRLITDRLESFEVLRMPADALLQRLRQGKPAARRDFVEKLSEAKLLRAVYSERQLQEVMVDFWFNHFNVFSGKGDEAALLPDYESRAILPNALGNFPKLLEAVARSPAMLVYLDNWRSAVPRPKAKEKRGINENYARELLELHTMGAGGGYTQEDVIEVARCFTGWTVADARTDPRFAFKPEMHDAGQKVVLGHLIPAGGGIEDASEVLHILAQHPATAKLVSTKLVRRFVSDDAPEALVRRVADTYQATEGDIRAMLRTIFESPEFWSRKALRAKVRSPLELVAAALRALDASISDPLPLAKAVGRIGEPLYGAQPPTGYPDLAQSWLSSGALLARIDFGLSLASGDVPGVRIDLRPIGAGPPAQVLAKAAETLGAQQLSDKTRGYILAQLEQTPQPAMRAARAVGLLLGAPEMQRR